MSVHFRPSAGSKNRRLVLTRKDNQDGFGARWCTLPVRGYWCSNIELPDDESGQELRVEIG